MADHSTAAESHAHAHHVTPPIYYVVNVLMLMILMGVTIWASSPGFVRAARRESMAGRLLRPPEAVGRGGYCGRRKPYARSTRATRTS